MDFEHSQERMKDPTRSAELIGMFADAIDKDGIRDVLGCLTDGIIAANRADKAGRAGAITNYLLCELMQKLETDARAVPAGWIGWTGERASE